MGCSYGKREFGYSHLYLLYATFTQHIVRVKLDTSIFLPSLALTMRGVATKRDPALWEACKQAACTEGGMCKHSARKMQWAVACYRKRGGTYSGPKSPDNKLARWTKQRWKTHSGRPSEGRRRYLPAAAWDRLTPSQIRRTNAAKRAGHARCKQWVRQPRDVAQVAARVRRESRQQRTKRSS